MAVQIGRHLQLEAVAAGLFLRHCEEQNDEAIYSALRGVMDCFAEPVIGRAFARPVGS